MTDSVKKWWECGRKRGWATKSSANKVLLRQRDYNNMHTYECPHCFMWHIGHIPKKPTPPAQKEAESHE